MNQLLSTFFIVTYKGGGVTRNAEIISSPSPIILLILTFPYLQKLIITEIIIGKKASITVPTHQSINSTLSSAVCLIMSSVVICTDSSCSTTNTSPPPSSAYIFYSTIQSIRCPFTLLAYQYYFISTVELCRHNHRHYCASIQHAIGIPDVYAARRMGFGWGLKSVYKHAMNDKTSEMNLKANKHFEELCNTKCNIKK